MSFEQFLVYYITTKIQVHLWVYYSLWGYIITNIVFDFYRVFIKKDRT